MSLLHMIIAEFVGTFIFVLVILHATSKEAVWPSLAPLFIGMGLLAGKSIAASTSGGHLNPAVSAVMLMTKQLSLTDFVPYVFAQLLGAVLAKLVFDLRH